MPPTERPRPLRARKPITQETLEALSAARQTESVLAAYETDVAFKRRENAALALGKGAAAVPRLIDRLLARLERSRSFIMRNKAKASWADLAELPASSIGDREPIDTEAAGERLIGLIATHESEFERLKAETEAGMVPSGPLTLALGADAIEALTIGARVLEQQGDPALTSAAGAELARLPEALP